MRGDGSLLACGDRRAGVAACGGRHFGAAVELVELAAPGALEVLARGGNAEARLARAEEIPYRSGGGSMFMSRITPAR
jgi:hypothetical protein